MSLPTKVVIAGVRPLRGHLRVPGDKSISHRALLFSGIANGTSRLRGVSNGEDVQRTRHAIELLRVGVRVENSDRGVEEFIVEGRGWQGLREPEVVVDCGNSGTSIRFLAGFLAGSGFHSVLTGDASITRRPMGRVVEPLRAMGALIDGRKGGTLAPLAIRGTELHGVDYELKVASAQVKSALLLAGLQAVGSTTIREPVRSRDHSERMLAAMGAPVEVADDGTLKVQAGVLEPLDLEVPGDPSSAAFFVVGACIIPGSDLVVEAVSLNPSRMAFLDVLKRMGADIEVEATEERCGEPVGNLRVRSGQLQGTVMEGSEIPSIIDEIPVLCVAAAFADGTTEIRDAAELRVKESDRIATMHRELAGVGVDAIATDDGLVIHGGVPHAGSTKSRSMKGKSMKGKSMKGKSMKSHGDHRVAMSMAILGAACEGSSTVSGWRAVGTSYPGFLDDLGILTGAAS